MCRDAEGQNEQRTECVVERLIWGKWASVLLWEKGDVQLELALFEME